VINTSSKAKRDGGGKAKMSEDRPERLESKKVRGKDQGTPFNAAAGTGKGFPPTEARSLKGPSRNCFESSQDDRVSRKSRRRRTRRGAHHTILSAVHHTLGNSSGTGRGGNAHRENPQKEKIVTYSENLKKKEWDQGMKRGDSQKNELISSSTVARPRKNNSSGRKIREREMEEELVSNLAQLLYLEPIATYRKKLAGQRGALADQLESNRGKWGESLDTSLGG